MSSNPHRRLNPLTNEWVLVSPNRNMRPWQGQIEKAELIKRPGYDEKCYLCPGNQRVGGEINPDYQYTFTFDNDFSALQFNPEFDEVHTKQHALFQALPESGICRVICYSPHHDLTLAQMNVNQISKVVTIWAEQTEQLGQIQSINHVQIFENKGAMMGCSNPHPHGQIWAQHSIPNQSLKEAHYQNLYFQSKKKTLLSDYLDEELDRQERLVYENDGFIVLIPYWAIWPYETLLISKRPVSYIYQLTADELRNLAQAIRFITIKYDNLFCCEFPYSAGLHQAPTDGQAHPYWHLHMHFCPPLLRSATVKKYMVGYEMFAESQRDITPESSAEQLRSVSDRHYLSQ